MTAEHVPVEPAVAALCADWWAERFMVDDKRAAFRELLRLRLETGDIGRIIGDISRSARPLVRADIACDSAGGIGKEAAVVIGQARERIADTERRIAAATWANGGRKP